MKRDKGNTMNCKAVSKAIEAFYEQTLSPGQERAIFEHLAKCRKCAEGNRETHDLLKALVSMSPSEAPSSLVGDVMNVLRAQNRQHPLVQRMAPASDPRKSSPVIDTRQDAPGEKHKSPSLFRRLSVMLPAAAVIAALLALPFLGNRFAGLNSGDDKLASVTSDASVNGSNLRVYSHSGDFALHDGKGWRSGLPGESLFDGIRIRVSRGSWLTLNLGTEATYLLGPESIATVLEQGRTINLEAGCISESVEKGNGRFKVRTALGTVTVVGTRFDVKVTRGGEAMVGVREGKVKVLDRMGRVRILEKNTAVSLDNQGAGEVQKGVSFLRPIQEVFVHGKFHDAAATQPDTAATDPSLPQVPPANVPAILLEKDMKPPVTLRDMF